MQNTLLTNKQIAAELNNKHQHFVDVISNLSDEQFVFTKNEKWSAGQQLEHILKSVKPVAMGFSLPLFAPKLLFGKAKRPSKSYHELERKYFEKLALGGKASAPYIPKNVVPNQKEQLIKSVLKSVNKIAKKIENMPEENLDKFILPHPLLGKLTFREMLYFTIFHVVHHERTVVAGVSGA